MSLESARFAGAVWSAIASRDFRDIGEARFVTDMPEGGASSTKSHCASLATGAGTCHCHRCGRLVAYRAAARASSVDAGIAFRRFLTL